MEPRSDRFNDILNSLPRNRGVFDPILIVRLAVSALLLALSLVLTEMLPVFRILLMILSALAIGYDLILDAIDAVMEGRYLDVSILLLAITVLAFVIGSGWEGCLVLLLYQFGRAMITLTVNKMKKSAQDILNPADPELREKVSVLIADEDAGKTKLEEEVTAAANLILRIAMALALVFAIVTALPFIGLPVREAIRRALMILVVCTPASVVVALPLSGIVGMSYATNFGVMFNNSRVMEKLNAVTTAVIDKNGVFTESEPQFVGVVSDILDEKTFMEFLAHAVYYSDQPFAKAISSLEDREYRLDLISDFHDIPGGIDVNIGGTPITLAKREVLTGRGVALPNEADEGSVYYLVASGRVIGKALFTESAAEENVALIRELKEVGFKKCVVLTEDAHEESERLGKMLDADEVYTEFTAETKLRYLESLESDSTLYLYANSLQMHSNAAVDMRVNRKGKYADATIVPEALGFLPEARELCARVRQIAVENAVFAFAVKALLIFLGMIGAITIWFAAFVDLAAALATILNTIRVTKDPLLEFGKQRNEEIEETEE
ncbi:MAG: HAD family hydrolase [Oscillospiraceae bacterium]|nr:HAD family hydrolase [Oscillospiraceae bacterium]